MMKLVRRTAKELLLVQQMGGWSCLAEYCGGILMTLPEIVRLGNFSPADRRMTGKKRTFKVFGQTLTLDGCHFSAAREIYGRKVYFAIPEFAINPTDTVVDLGANNGLFTVLAAKLAAKVIAVEAQSRYLSEMHSNARANNCDHKISAAIALVGGGTGIFSDPTQLLNASHFAQQPPVCSMKQIIEQHGLATIDFLKIDIEGSEFDLFSRETAWLACVNKIAMEVHADYGRVDNLVGILKTNGFRVWLIDNERRVVKPERNSNGYLFARKHSWQSPARVDESGVAATA
jgi:FkbM family methyltransferase